MENNNTSDKNDIKQIHKEIECNINKMHNINDNGDDIKMLIEDSFENQEKEYEENQKKPKKKRMSLIPLYIVLVLGFNLIILNIYGDDNIFIPFITFLISLYIIFKYVPKKAKDKFIREFEETFKNITNLIYFFDRDINREKKLKKYIAVSSEDQKNLLKDDEKEDNYMESPLLNI